MIKLCLVLTLTVVVCLCQISDFERSLAVSTSQSECKTCVNNGSQRWCAPVGATQSNGECCNSGDTSGYCASSSSYACSGSTNVQGTAGLILCPDIDANCGDTNHHLYSTNYYWSLVVNSLPSGSVCTERFYKSGGSIDQAQIRMNSISGATATVYKGPRGEANYTEIGILNAGSTATVSFSTTVDVYVVINPYSASVSYNITAKGAIAPTTSGNTTDSISGGSKTNLTALWVVLGCVGGLALIVAGIVTFICIRRRKKKSKKELHLDPIVIPSGKPPTPTLQAALHNKVSQANGNTIIIAIPVDSPDGNATAHKMANIPM
ncbi:unnamed protein product [Moneuplotes crassus]|uniref:Uncharacterized protein n=1 Tax=Euplotes crassus TaxID=5936 RepID=A0AAD2DAM5_EUPCR|nr:unnamed protein product [Moneuplotes crassus]